MHSPDAEPNTPQPDRTALPVPSGDPLDLTEEFSAEDMLSDEPAVRVRQLGRLRSGYAWEYIRQSLHPLLLARVPMVAIAERFNVSVHTVYRWRDRLHEEMRREAVTMQPRDFIMNSLTALREIRAEAWKGFQTAEIPKQRQFYIDLALKVESNIVKLGHAIGLYGSRGDRPLHPGTCNEPNGAEGGADVLKQMARAFLASRPDLIQDDDPVQEHNVEPDPTLPAPPLPPVFSVRSRQRRPAS